MFKYLLYVRSGAAERTLHWRVSWADDRAAEGHEGGGVCGGANIDGSADPAATPRLCAV